MASTGACKRGQVSSMPALSLPVLSASIGLVLAWSARATEGPSARGTWLVVSYALLVHAPAAATLMVLNPDWTFGYVLTHGRLQTASILGATLLVAAAVPLGYMLGSRRGARPLVWALALFAACAANTLALLERVGKDASYIEYHNDFGVASLAGSALGYTLIWALIAVGSALLFTHTALRKLAQQRETSPPFLTELDE
jgi:hypothetical protein